MPTVVSVNGDLVPPEEAKVSVFDRGFLYGDSVYEVIRTYGNLVPFELRAHLARLHGSAARIGMRLPWMDDEVERQIHRALEASRGDEPSIPDAAPWNIGQRYIRVVVTRGAGEIGLDPALAVKPQTIIIVRRLDGPPLRPYREGVSVCIVSVERVSARAVDPAAKTGNYLNSILAVSDAKARMKEAVEALMLDAQGFVTEGATSNIFMVSAGRLRTPPLSAGILEGVTRRVVLELARALGIPVDESPIRAEELAAADELFLSSTVREVLPVTRLDDDQVKDGQVGPVTHRLLQAFRARTA